MIKMRWVYGVCLGLLLGCGSKQQVRRAVGGKYPLAQLQPLTFNVKDVQSIYLQYKWTGYGNSRLSETMELKKVDDVWFRRVFERDGLPNDESGPLGDESDPSGMKTVGKLVAGFSQLQPVYHFQTCQSHAQDYPVISLILSGANGEKIRIQSRSNCASMIPWNVTDGNYFYASYEEEFAQVMFKLLGRKISQGFGNAPERPEEPPGQVVDIDGLFGYFQEILTELLVDEPHRVRELASVSAMPVKTLRWMAPSKFQERLEGLAANQEVDEKVRNYAISLLLHTDIQ